MLPGLGCIDEDAMLLISIVGNDCYSMLREADVNTDDRILPQHPLAPG
jgi:hypothetical protein